MSAPRKLIAALAGLLVLASANIGRADFTGLGSASGFSVLGLNNSTDDFSLVTVNGNVGVDANASLKVMAPSKVNGNIFLDPTATFQNMGTNNISGSIITQSMAGINSDALLASSNDAALTPTQTFGNISSSTTITGNGGLNVIKVNGSISNTVNLSGGANDIFVLNVTGTATLGGSSVLGNLSGGVTPNHVLYNFVGASGQTITWHVGNTTPGMSATRPTARSWPPAIM